MLCCFFGTSQPPYNSSTHSHAHTGPDDSRQMVSSMAAEQHTYAGYNSAKSSTLKPGRPAMLCSQVTNIYREITHLHSQSSHRWCCVSARWEQGAHVPPVLSGAARLLTDRSEARSEATDDHNEALWRRFILSHLGIVGCQCVSSGLVLAKRR